MKRAMVVLPTQVGHAEWGDNRFRGFSVRDELAGHETYTGMLVLAITGRRPDASESALLDDLATVMTVGDPRIWPLKLVRVVSSYGGCLAPVAAATVSLEGALVGHDATARAAELLLEIAHDLRERDAPASDATLEQACRARLVPGRRLVGFGVPFRSEDERVAMLAIRVAARGRQSLEHWVLFERIAAAFRRLAKLEPNIGLAAAAVCLDLGLSPRQIGPLVTALGSADYFSNAYEGASQAAEVLRELPLENIRYVGVAATQSPRALASKP